MATFRYLAKSRTGERREGTLDAPDKRTALARLQRNGLIPVRIADADAAGGNAASSTPAKASAKAPSAAPAPSSPAAALPAKKPQKQEKKPLLPAKSPARQASFAGGAGGGAKAKATGGSGGGGLQLSGFLHRRPRLKPAALLLLTRELADLLSSGMTLGTALHALAQRKTNTSQDIILPDIRDEIVGGSSLSGALAKWPESFPPLYVSMVKVGEASGQLPAVLERLVGHFERVQATREKVHMALVYPCIVAVIGVLAIIFMMTAVIPQFTKMFEELGGTLPLATRMLIGMSDGLLKYGWAMAIGIVAVVVLVRRALATPAGRSWKDRMALKLPVASKIVRSSAYSTFAHTLETLLANGVQMLPALGIVETTITNTHLAAAVRDARDRIADGTTLSRPLSQTGLFPRMLTDMLAVGEESGDMPTALDHIGRRYDNELDRAVKVFTTLLEPMMMLMIAIGVGFVAVAMLSAVFEMTSGLQH